MVKCKPHKMSNIINYVYVILKTYYLLIITVVQSSYEEARYQES